MQKLIAIAVLTATIGFTASCSKSPDKVLPRKDGVWKATGIYTQSGISLTIGATYTFKKDGTLTYQTDGQNTIEPGKWSYSDDESITLTETDGTNPEVYDVTEMEAKSQKWERIIIENGVTSTLDVILIKK